MGVEHQFEVDPLYRIEKFMASMTDLDSLLVVIMREAAVATDAESCSLALYDENTDELYFYIARGEKEEREFERRLRYVRIKMGSGVVGWCAVNRKSVNINDVYSDPRFNREADKQTGFVTRSILAVPMLRRGKLIGVVEAVNKRAQNGFFERDEKVLTVLAAQAALVIENARLYEDSVRRARLSALGQAITGTAHCIKNILMGLDGGSYILERGIQKHNMESVAQGWDILKRNTQIMRDLALDMLTFSRPRDPEYEASDINEICTGIAQMMRSKARDKNVEISLDLHPDMGKVTLDPKAIYRCILNLVGNAIDACAKVDGMTKIATRLLREKDSLEISVSDNGCGIREEDMKKLFEPFFSTKGSKGTGLGLSVTYKIVQEHAGEIRVESQVDVGTEFIMTLPLKPPTKHNSEPGEGVNVNGVRS